MCDLRCMNGQRQVVALILAKGNLSEPLLQQYGKGSGTSLVRMDAAGVFCKQYRYFASSHAIACQFAAFSTVLNVQCAETT